MKKYLLILLIAAIALSLLAGCSTADSPAAATESAAEPSGSVGVANPYFTVTPEEIKADTGVSITLPEGICDCAWNGIKGDPVLYTVDFLYDTCNYTLRVQRSPEGVDLGITGMYYGWELPQGADFDPYGSYCFVDETEHVGALVWAEGSCAFSLTTDSHADAATLERVRKDITITVNAE